MAKNRNHYSNNYKGNRSSNAPRTNQQRTNSPRPQSTSATEGLSNKQKEQLGFDLAALIAETIRENGSDPFQGFIGLTQQLAQKQKELDAMATDSLPAAILSDYVMDVLTPNSTGTLISVVANDPEEQKVIDSIYKRFSFPFDKCVYSLLKNGILIGEFEQLSRESVASRTASATESVEDDPVATDNKVNAVLEGLEEQPKESPATEQVATEQTFLRKPGEIFPNLSIKLDTYTVYPILRYERCVGFIEVKKDLRELEKFNWETDSLSYTDVVIHPVSDYVYKTFGVPHSSKPLQLTVTQEDGTIAVYDVAQGCSILEDAYTAWKTLALLYDSIVLAALIKNTQFMLVSVEAGTATAQQIEQAKIRLRNLFEGQLSLSRQGMKSYLNPQSKPAFVYSFTSNGVGKIDAATIGGEFNPGQLYYLNPYVNQFFSAMGAPKQNYGFTEGSAGLDSGSAVEQYDKRWGARVSVLKRCLGDFIKDCINHVLIDKGLSNLVNEFTVQVTGVYDEQAAGEVTQQQNRLSFYKDAVDFLGVEDPQVLLRLKSVILKQIIIDPQVSKLLDEVVSEATAPEEETPAADQPPLGEMDDSQLSADVADELGVGGGGGGEIGLDMDTVSADAAAPAGGAGGGGGELPEMADVTTEGE